MMNFSFYQSNKHIFEININLNYFFNSKGGFVKAQNRDFKPLNSLQYLKLNYDPYFSAFLYFP